MFKGGVNETEWHLMIRTQSWFDCVAILGLLDAYGFDCFGVLEASVNFYSHVMAALCGRFRKGQILGWCSHVHTLKDGLFMYVEEKDILGRMEWKYWNVSCCWGVLRNLSQFGEKVMSQLLLDCLCCVYGWGTLERMNTKEEETISGSSDSIIANFQLL